MTLAGKRPRRLYRLLVRTEMLKSVAPWLLVLLISDIASSAPLTQLHRDTGTSCSHLIPVLLKSEGSVANQCSPVAEWSAERRAIIEAVTIEFVPAIKDTSWLSSITLEAMGEHGPAEVSLFTGKVNRTTTTVDVSLKSKLSGVTKVKVHSFPPERCIKATLWVCYDPITETKGDRLDPRSMHSVGGSQQVISKDNPTNGRRQVQDGDDSNLANSWRVLTEHRVKRAAGNAASSVTTPRTYSWLQAAIVGCISVISMAVLPSLFIALLCCNRKKNQSREKDKKLIISEKLPPFTSTNNPMDAPSMSSLDKLGECKSSIDGDLNGSVYDLATPTVSTFHSVHSNAISLTNILDASSVNSTPSKVPPPPQVSTPSSSNSTHSHPKLRRISQQVQTVDMQFKSPLTPPSSDTKAPPMPNVLQLAPPPAAKPRSSRVVVTNSTDDLLYCPDDKGETNSFTTFKTLQKPPAKRTLTNDSVSSMGSESLISYVLTPEMLAGGQRSRSGTIESLQSQSSAFSDISAAQKRTSTGSNLQYQQYLSPSAAAAGRGNRSSLCEEQLISSSAIVEVRQSGLVHNQNVVKSDTGADQNSLPLKLPKHLRVDQSRPFSIAAGCLPEETDFAVLGITSESATAVDTEETKSSSLTSSTIRFLRSQLWSQSSQDESTLDRGTRSRHSSSGVIHSREGSEVFDDSVETASLNSPCRASPKALNKRAKKINKKKRKPVMSPPRTPPPLPPTPPPPSSLSPGPPTFPHAPPTPPPPSSLPPGPPTFPYGPSTSPPLSSLPPRPPTLSPPIPPPPSSLPPGPPTFPHAPPMPPPPSSLPPGPPTFPHAPSTPPPPLSLPPGPPTRPFPPPTPPPRAKRTGNSNNVEVNAIRNSIESDLGDFETVKPAQEEHSVCISCGIRIDESTTTQQAGQSEDPVYLRVLPDGDHESCSVDVTDASKAVDTTDADTHTADPTDSKQKKKLLRKEDSVPSYHLLEQGRLICMDCLNRDGPIYHELEVVQSDSELLAEDPTPPIPPRPRPLKPKDPIYERVASLNRNQHLQARKFSQSSEEGSYITTVARKPRSLHLGSSSDYESVPSQTNTSPFFQPNISAQQLAAKFEQRDKQSEPLPSPPPPPPHRNRPHPPPLAKLRGEDEHSTSSHDYESVSSFEHSRVKRKVSDHDYAHIGPAPSLESLDEPLSSPPYIPDGATRAKLLKIDSQGYATVIPAGDVLDSDEVDCLQFSDGEECPINPSQLSCRDDDNWREQRENGYAPLTPQRRRESSKSAAATFSKQGGDEDECRDEPPPSPPLSTTPQDYEVPMNILQLSPIRSRDSTVVSPKLTRQRAVSSTSDAETKRLSLASKSGGDVVQEEEKLENGEAIVEVKSHDEVFDSGIETSVDSQDVRTATGSKDSSGSKCDELKQENHDELTTDHSSSNGSIRPRSMTVHAMVMSEHQNGGDGQNCNGSQFQKDGSSLYRKQTSMPSLLPPKALHISLDQNRHAIV